MTIEIYNNDNEDVVYVQEYQCVPENIAKAVKVMLDGCIADDTGIVSGTYEYDPKILGFYD